MAEIPELTTQEPVELVGAGRRHLAVRDYSAAVGSFALACELLAQRHGDQADQCAEPYLWYGKALLGLSREESGVLGDGIAPGGNGDNEEDGDDDDEKEENGENETEQNGDDEKEDNEAAIEEKKDESGTSKPKEEESKSKEHNSGEPGTSNGETNGDDPVAEPEDEDEIENLQLAWEMLDLARGILTKRVGAAGEVAGATAARALLAEALLTLGEVALESETYDKAVLDMESCLEIQKELYGKDDRRIAETHYQIGLANSLSSNFEEAITHFKNAANILESRIKTLESPSLATDEAAVKKFSGSDPFYTVAGEIKELKELLPEIQEKIQDMLDYKAETIKRVRETLYPSNGEGHSEPEAASSSGEARRPASDISHLIKRKRKSSQSEDGATAAKRTSAS